MQFEAIDLKGQDFATSFAAQMNQKAGLTRQLGIPLVWAIPWVKYIFLDSQPDRQSCTTSLQYRSCVEIKILTDFI